MSSSHTIANALKASCSSKWTPAGRRGAISSVRLRSSFCNSLFRRGTVNGRVLKLKVVVEAGEELATVQIQLLQSFIQIEKIAVLAPLQERPQLRPEEFFRLERDDLRLPLMPAAIYR